jgi:hypothetical protein
MLIFLHNGFNRDFLALRTARLLAIKTYILAWRDILFIPEHIVNWALAAYDKWVAALGKSQVEMGEAEVAYQAMHDADKPTFEYYARCKALLLDTYGLDNQKLEIYGATGQFPKDRKRRMKAVADLLDGHARLVATGDPDVLPDAFINTLQGYYDASNDAFANFVLKEKPEAMTAVDVQDSLFNADTEMLRVLYSWALMTWSRYEPNLVQLGFAPRTGQQGGSGGGGGEVPAAPTGFMFEWLEPVLQFSWDAVEGATSYQIAFSEDGGVVWEELYTGEEVGYEYEPPEGLQYYRVRARNADGYGDWSEVVEFEIEGAPPMGEWPNELTGFYAIHHDVPVIFNEVGHDGQAGADSFRLKRVKVSIADPDPTNADMPEENYVEGLNEDPFADSDIASGDKCAYWACGVDAADVEGE